ncbi:hypothetical protein CCR75_008529 [Bremia lactucae]|uniref:Uncharacterized protein n=1 Tax=Bremia lactucae TaxID=4779 RepID=A0A976FHW3_BRELC|nr:hypothetical protein CCR75_008529 [Bremia lactucae]
MSCEEELVNVRPLNEAQSKYRLCTAWRLAATAAFGSLLVITQGTNSTHHLHAHIAKHQILRNLQEQPALRLTFELKRKAMYVHGASTFDVIATPAPKRSINDKRMAFNGIASFVKEGNVHEYSLVDGMSYYTHRPSGLAASVAQSTCLPAGTIPPIGSALDAIKNARTFVQTSADNRKCPDSSVMLFEFAGEDFFLCADHFWAPNVGFQIFGKHVDIHVKYEQTVPEIVAPRVPTASINACKQVSFGDRVTPSLPSMLTRSLSEWSHRALRAEFNLFKDMWDLVTDESSCSCKGVKRASRMSTTV